MKHLPGRIALRYGRRFRIITCGPRAPHHNRIASGPTLENLSRLGWSGQEAEQPAPDRRSGYTGPASSTTVLTRITVRPHAPSVPRSPCYPPEKKNRGNNRGVAGEQSCSRSLLRAFCGFLFSLATAERGASGLRGFRAESVAAGCDPSGSSGPVGARSQEIDRPWGSAKLVAPRFPCD